MRTSSAERHLSMSNINLVRQPHTGYLSFSTPGFHNTTETPAADTSILGADSASSLLPSKRSSSDPPDEAAFIAGPVKRTKLNHGKENVFGSSSTLKTQSTTASSIPQRQPAKRVIIEVDDDDDDLPQTTLTGNRSVSLILVRFEHRLTFEL